MCLCRSINFQKKYPRKTAMGIRWRKKIVDSKPLLPVIVIVEISTLWMHFHFSVIDALVCKKMLKS